MMTRMWQVVDAPRNRPPRGATLVRSANEPADGDARWEAGLRYQPEACGGQVVGAAGVCGSGFVGLPDPAVRPDVLDYVPPFVAAAQACSAISGEQALRDAEDRARRLLDLCETVGIARELWRGDVAQAEAPDLPNAWLAQEGVVDVLNAGAATPAIEAFAWLEAELATCSCGGVGMIHASPFTATIWSAASLVERQADGRLLSALGTIVVADPGYDGSAPDGTTDPTNAVAWAYATSMVDLRRGAVEVIGDPQTINRQTNDFDVYAYRPFAATFDPCCHLGVQVDHAVRS